MSTAISPMPRSRTASAAPNATSSVPPPLHLSTAQEQELEAELHRELAALERRLVSERMAESADAQLTVAHDPTEAARRMSDIMVRHDLVAAALARLASGEYGTCSRCGEAIPYGRLLVMPEATSCLSCSGRP